MVCLSRKIPLILVTLLLLFFIVPAGSKVNLNTSGFSLTVRESKVFYQGYVLTIQAVNNEGDKVWLQLSHDNQTVKNEILGKGDRFNYSQTINNINQSILDVQIDNIYTGADNYLVSFYPVFYLEDDLTWPTPTPGQETPIPPKTPPKPGQPILYIFGILVILFILVRLLRTLR